MSARIMSTRITIATAMGAVIAALALITTPAFAEPTPRTLRVEKAEDPTAALIRTERARLKQLQAERKAEREARANDKRRAEIVRIRERIAALESRPAGK